MPQDRWMLVEGILFMDGFEMLVGIAGNKWSFEKEEGVAIEEG